MVVSEDVQRSIQQYRWYHSIPLGNGLYTPGKRSYQDLAEKLEMMKLPSDLTGRSVLDVGCNEGYFSIEAHNRGASMVLGLDNEQRKDVERKYALIKSILNHGAEFQLMDVCEMDPNTIGTFDMVFFLSVFHHLRYPFLALDKVAAVTGKVAVMEFVVIDTPSDKANSILVRGFGHKGKVRLFPNRQFLTEMLRTAGFGEIEFLGSHSRRRYLDTPAEAEKVMLKAYK